MPLPTSSLDLDPSVKTSSLFFSVVDLPEILTKNFLPKKGVVGKQKSMLSGTKVIVFRADSLKLKMESSTCAQIADIGANKTTMGMTEQMLTNFHIVLLLR